MLVFIDESGDSGLKLAAGSSPFFVVTLVVFQDNEEATKCDHAISELRREMGLPETFEFRFSKICPEFRSRFLARTAGFDFFYFSIVINKAKLYGEGFKYKDPFYKYTCSLVFNNAKPYLTDATVVIDGSGSRDFRQQLDKYLRSRINTQGKVQHIRKVKIQNSANNNLIQLADMVCGAVARGYRENRKHGNTFRKLISHREIYVQVWPK